MKEREDDGLGEVWAWIAILFALIMVAVMASTGCKPTPHPQPTPTPTATPAPTPEPTPTVDVFHCPEFDPAKLRLPCGPHSERGDGWTLWDCTLRTSTGPYMPEGHPEALRCQLEAAGGRANFVLVGAQGSLTLKLRDTNAFQFLLSGTGTGYLQCWANGYDLCRNREVSR